MENIFSRLCTSKNVFILSLLLLDSLARYGILSWRAFPFRILKTSPHFLFVSRDSIEKFKAILTSDSLYVTFSLF